MSDKFERITFEVDEDTKILFADACRRRKTTMAQAMRDFVLGFITNKHPDGCAGSGETKEEKTPNDD